MIQKLTQLSGYLIGVSKTSRFWQAAEWYLASGKRYRVKQIDANKGEMSLALHSKRASSLLTLIRKTSYVIVFLPVIAAIIRHRYRKHYVFKVQSKAIKMSKLISLPQSPNRVPKSNPHSLSVESLSESSTTTVSSSKDSSISTEDIASSQNLMWFQHVNQLIGGYRSFILTLKDNSNSIAKIILIPKLLSAMQIHIDNYEKLYLGRKSQRHPQNSLHKKSFKQFTDLFIEMLSLFYPDLKTPPPLLVTNECHKKLLQKWQEKIKN